MAGEMVGGRGHARGEDQAGGVDVALSRRRAQIVDRRVRVAAKRENALRRALEDAHPAIERGGRDLVVVVEAAEDELALGQRAVGAAETPIGDWALGIVTEQSCGR